MNSFPKLETFGDVRHKVNASLEPSNLHTVGGDVYPYMNMFRFGVENDENSPQGEAFCLLPNGWAYQTYLPKEIGEQTGPKDRLRFKVSVGVGKMAVHNIWVSVSNFSITPGFEAEIDAGPDGVQYSIENSSDSDLLIVHAQSVTYPANRMDINPSSTDAESFANDYPLSKFSDF